MTLIHSAGELNHLPALFTCHLIDEANGHPPRAHVSRDANASTPASARSRWPSLILFSLDLMGLWLTPLIWALGLGQIVSCAAQTPTSPPLVVRPTASVVISLDKATEILSHHTPDFPAEARARHLSGTGVYELEVLQETGEVSSVTVVSSTGYPILDHAAIKALKRWGLRPHTEVVRVKVPITFNYN